MYIIIAILLFGILIAAHEWGALYCCPALRCHRPRIFHRNGSGYLASYREEGDPVLHSCSAIGGYCAMEGEEEESNDPHSLNNQGFWKKVFVFAAGALMNLSWV